jgi:hypothetical protein
LRLGGGEGKVGPMPEAADPPCHVVAQAVGAMLVTADQRILSWTGPLERHDARL